MAFIDENFFDFFDDSDGKITQKLEQKWSKRMDEMVNVMKSDLQRETTPYRTELGWNETPTFPHGSKQRHSTQQGGHVRK